MNHATSPYPPLQPLMPGVPDIHSLRNALAAGYVVHDGRLWWPTYDHGRGDIADFHDSHHVRNQERRTGLRTLVSPDYMETRVVPLGMAA